MANTKVTGDLIASSTIATGNIADNAVTSDKISGITTAHITEGSNLYYTDARADARVALIVDSAPATLDTLNELAAALGDDPNFATTTATSIGLKAPLASPSFTGNATFAGKILSSSTSNGIELNQSTAGSATYYVMDNTVETGGKRYRFGYSGGSSDKGSFSIYNETDSLMPLLLSGSNSTFAGNVGIGVAAHATASLNITNTDQHIRLNNGSELGIITLDADGKLDFWAHGTDETINFRTGTGSGTVTMSVVGEKVGIGTTSPAEKLQVAGNIRMFSGGYPLIDMGITTSNYFRLIHDNPNDVFKIGKNGAGTLNITGSGNVGIGTTAPMSGTNSLGLQIAKGAESSLFMGNPQGGQGAVFQTSDNRHRAIIGANVYDDPSSSWNVFTSGKGIAGISLLADTGGWGTGIDFWCGDTDSIISRMNISSNGNVNIGVTYAGSSAVTGPFVVSHTSSRFLTSSYELSVVSLSAKNNNNNLESLKLAGDSIYFFNGTNTTGSQSMVILNSGNVGIGVTSPTQKLEVNGNIAIRDTYKIFFNHNINTGRYIGASSSNDLDIASNDDINYRSNFNRFWNGGTEFARLSGSTSSWIANDSNGKLGIGTTSPSSKLTVYGGGTTSSTLELRGAANGGDNATISTQQSMVFQIGSAGATGRSFTFSKNGLGYSDGTALFAIDANGGTFNRLWPQTGTSGSSSVVQTTLIPEPGIYEYFLQGNPNAAGSGSYRSLQAGLITIAVDYTSAKSVFLRIKRTVTAQDGGGSSNIQLNLNVYMLYNGSASDEQSIGNKDASVIYLTVSGYAGTVGSGQILRLTRKV
jgi:hypothetical protein